MIELTAIYAILLPLIPTVSAVIGMICAIIRTAKNNKDTLLEITQPIVDAYDKLREEVNNKKEANLCIEEMRQMIEIQKQYIEENRLLREQNAEYLTIITKLRHEVK